MPFMRSESCSFIWHPKVVTWYELTVEILGALWARPHAVGALLLGASTRDEEGDECVEVARADRLAEVLRHRVGRESGGDLRIRIDDRLADEAGGLPLQ